MPMPMSSGRNGRRRTNGAWCGATAYFNEMKENHISFFFLFLLTCVAQGVRRRRRRRMGDGWQYKTVGIPHPWKCTHRETKTIIIQVARAFAEKAARDTACSKVQPRRSCPSCVDDLWKILQSSDWLEEKSPNTKFHSPVKSNSPEFPRLL